MHGKGYYEAKKSLAASEMAILQHLAFNVHVQHPLGLLMCYLNQLDLHKDSRIMQRSWSYLNDRCALLISDVAYEVSLRTNVYVSYQPQTIACAAIFLATHDFGVNLRTDPPWWDIFEATLDDIQNIAGHMRLLYTVDAMSVDNLPWTQSELEEFLKSSSINT
jgi:hypothetical protein